MNPSTDLVNKLWRLCALLRKDGVTYQQYVTELTYLLFLKMASEQKDESRIPEQYRWGALKSAPETEVLTRYRQALVDLGDGSKVADRSVVAIFQNAATIVREPANLRKLIDAIDALHWFSEERDAFGDAYEGLLQKMAEETKRGAGQYFTPRALIQVMVELMQPQAGEVIQDPAAGTGGFLIAADRDIRSRSDDYFELSERLQKFQLGQAFRGLENVPDTFRLLLMNLHLHRMDPDHLELADTLGPKGAAAPYKNADLILTNPPFGPAGGPPTRDDLTITDRVSSYQLPFVEHCIRALRLGGRAAVVVPDSVLSDADRGKALRQRLMSWCNLHTILRLPVGIFYAQGVKTNVLFFTRADEEAPAGDATKAVWIYDARSGAPSYGKTNPFKAADLADFVKAFGDDPLGSAGRKDQGETGRFRCFTRDEIAAKDDSLDIRWLADDSPDPEDGLDQPADLAAAVDRHLTVALEELQAILDVVGAVPTIADESHAFEVEDLPQGWSETTLGECQGRTSSLDPRDFRDEQFDLFSVPSYSTYTPEVLYGSEIGSAKQIVQPGDVLLCKIVPHIRRAWTVPPARGRRQIASGEWIVFRDHGLDPNYLRRFVLSDAFHVRFMMTVAGVGGSLMRARPSEVAKIEVPVPPRAEQTRIVNQLEVLISRLVRLREELARVVVPSSSNKEARLLDRLEAAILAKAFRGELAPQDPNDEPASVLLDRIRAQRAATPKPKRGRRKLGTSAA